MNQALLKKTEDAPKKTKGLVFTEHLEELRSRLLKCIAVVVVTSCFFYRVIDPALEFLIRPIGRLVFISPAEAFLAVFTLTVLGGTITALPFLFYQIWAFVSVALTEDERRYVKVFGPLSLMFFILGVSFAYFVILPISLNFLLMFSSDLILPMITVDKYISFVGTLALGFGVIFEMPLIIVFLTKIGIATPAFLIQKRRHAIVSIFVASAVLTPPDYVSQILMAVPLILLYEISILFAKLTYRTQGL